MREKVLAAAVKLTVISKEAAKRKGLLPRPMRAVVVGMPNVGKSSLINWLIGRKKTKVADRPGITRGPQWVRVHPQIELLDTPGILPHVSLTQDVQLKLALLNLVPERTYDAEDTARLGLLLIQRSCPELISSYAMQGETPTLETIAAKRNFLTAGGRLDTTRAASKFLTDLRQGALGKVTLDIYADLV